MRRSGEYCCGICSVALLRAASADAYGDRDERVSAGVRGVRAHRRDGRWGNYPFYYTLLALSNLDTPEAIAELEYARPACERALRACRGNGTFTVRRRELLTRTLDRDLPGRPTERAG